MKRAPDSPFAHYPAADAASPRRAVLAALPVAGPGRPRGPPRDGGAPRRRPARAPGTRPSLPRPAAAGTYLILSYLDTSESILYNVLVECHDKAQQ